MRKFIFAILFLLIAGPGWGATYYVNPSGTLLGDGSVSAPFSNLERISLVPLSASDVINITGSKTTPSRGTLIIDDNGGSGTEIIIGESGTPSYITASCDISDGATFEVSNSAFENKNRWLQDWSSATNADLISEFPSGSSTINRESTEKIFGDYSMRFDVDVSDSQVYARFPNCVLAAEKTKIKLLYKNDVGGSLKFDVVSATTGDFLQSDGTWDSATYRPTITSSQTWAIFETPEFIPDTNGGGYRVQVFGEGASTSSYLQGFAIEVTPEWKQYSGDVYYINLYNLSSDNIGLAKSTSWDTNGLDSLELIFKVDLLANIEAGKFFYDDSNHKLYYQLASGETDITSIHFETIQQNNAVKVTSDYVIGYDLYLYGAKNANLNNSGSIASYYDSYFQKSWVYGAKDDSSANATYYDCVAQYNSDLLFDDYADSLKGNGFVTDGAGTVSTYWRVKSLYNGDDGFQNDNSSEIKLYFCLANGNYSEQLSVKLGPATVYNSTFLNGSTGYSGHAVINDQNASGAVSRIFKNNLAYSVTGSMCVNFNDITGVTESNNAYYGGAVDSPWGVTNGKSSDPLISSTGKISNSSPCIGAGIIIDTINNTGTTDPWGNYVILNTGPDIGAHQYNPKGGNRSTFPTFGRY